jgi:hypothetical protein
MTSYALANAAVPLLSAALGAVLGAWAGAHYQRRKDRAQSVDQALQKLYELLLDLRVAHFRVVSNEVRGREVKPQALAEVEQLRYVIGDLLRQSPGVVEQRRVLKVLFSMSYRSEMERHHAIDSVADRVGRRANPRHARAMRRIIRQNERELMRDPEEYMRRLAKVGPP